MLEKVRKLMPPDKATNFPKIRVKVFSLASLSQNCPQDHPLPNHVGKSLKNNAFWQGHQFYKDS
jgi:hypothetical protein